MTNPVAETSPRTRGRIPAALYLFVIIAGIWIDVGGTGVPSGTAVRPDRILRRLSDLRPRGEIAVADDKP